jgi:DNA-binding transcriptional MerR regulator
VRVLDTVQDDDEARAFQDVFQFAVLDGGSQGDDALVRAGARQPVQGLAGFEANRDAALARQADQLLDPGPGGAPGDDEAVESAARAQRFTHRVNSGQQTHVNRQDSNSGGSALRRGGLQWLWMRPEAAPAPDPAEIPDKLYFRIGEVASLLGVEPYVLRYWEKEFPRLSPRKSGRDHRLYRRKDVELALEIKRLLYDSRYTIEGARKALAGRGKRAPRKAEPQPQAQGGLFEAPQSGVVEMVRTELEEILRLLR